MRVAVVAVVVAVAVAAVPVPEAAVLVVALSCRPCLRRVLVVHLLWACGVTFWYRLVDW